MSKLRMSVSPLLALVMFTVGIVIPGCSQVEPDPIRYGEDNCAYCRMTVVDRQFGTELVTSKRKMYKFDSIECLAAFYRRGDIAAEDIHSLWITDFSIPETLVAVPDATFVITQTRRSPMGMGLFGFTAFDSAQTFATSHNGTILPWDDVVDEVAKAWLDNK